MKYFALLSVSLTIFVGLYYLIIFGFAPAWEGDSIAYHIPIAKLIQNGSIFQSIPQDKNGIYFYPGNSSALIALFLILGIPLNLFNLLSWIVLAIIMFFIGVKFGLKRDWAILFSGSVITLNTVTRLIPTQVADIWITVFFFLAILLLEKKTYRTMTYLLIGIVIGVVIGMKYSGPLYALVLGFLYTKKFLKGLNIYKFLIFLIPILSLGGIWYFRNFIFVGNPIYPANLPNLAGHPNFQDQNFALWRTPFAYHDGLFRIVEAFISEYIFWTISPLIGLTIFIFNRYKKLPFTLPLKLQSVLNLGLLLLTVSLLLPIPTINIISNMRYLLICMIPFILGMFLLAQSMKKIELLAILALLNSVFVLSQLHFRPKLAFIYIVFLAIIFLKYDILMKYIKAK